MDGIVLSQVKFQMHAIPEVKLSLEWIGVKLKPTVKLSGSEESKIWWW